VSIATELDSLLNTAAATLASGPKTTVRAGEPDAVSDPTIAYWYTGTGTWEANTLSRTQEHSDWHIRIQLPAGPRYVPSDGAMEGWLEDAVNAVRQALWGAVGLGGAATGKGIELSDAKTGWANAGGQWTRLADMDLQVDLSNVHPIAQ
jgi:hypothetical protein